MNVLDDSLFTALPSCHVLSPGSTDYLQGVANELRTGSKIRISWPAFTSKSQKAELFNMLF
jgi:hypothetical protein